MRTKLFMVLLLLVTAEVVGQEYTYTKPATKALLWTPPTYGNSHVYKSPYSYTPRYTPKVPRNYRHYGSCAARRAAYIANQYVHPRSYYVRFPY